MNKEELEYEEDISEYEEDVHDGNVTNPFSTKDIKITNAVVLLPSLINRIKHDEIENPAFQRNSDLWNSKQMSRLIESILLKLPLPIFYFDVSNTEKWLIVDGLQRISTIRRFFVDKSLKLNNLEFLTELNGKKYDDLDRSFQRTIDDTEFVTYQIEAQTPKKVRYSIFNRINTGGLSLNAQEIRQALNQQGHGVNFLQRVCEDETFKNIVNVSNKRMLDRELVLRFIAFKLINYQEFKFNKMAEFLDEAMERLDAISNTTVLNNLKNELLNTLIFSEKILGKNHRFSRSIADNSKTKTLNRSLFDAIMVSFNELEEKNMLLESKEAFLKKFKDLLLDEQSDFVRSITEGTSSRQAIEIRLHIMRTLIKEVINED